MEIKFGETLRNLRQKNGITQSELAKILSVGRATIAGYETKGKQPDFEKLIRLSHFFHVSIDCLLNNDSSNDGMAKKTAEEDGSYPQDYIAIDSDLKALLSQLEQNPSFVTFNGISMDKKTQIALKNALIHALNMTSDMIDV